jgi:PPM family protein phosphatase
MPSTDEKPQLHVRAYAHTDTGLKRANNEDAFLLEPDHGLFAVSDGMGGHSGGEVASGLAVETLRRGLGTVPDADYLGQPTVANRRALFKWLTRSVDSINQAIQNRADAEPVLQGMGCTLDAVLVRGNGLFVAHVGDSRVYQLRKGKLTRLTEDHSFGQMLLSSGALTAEEVAKHPQRNVLTRALGPFPTVQVDTAYVEITAGDVFLLCSDGLYNEVSADDILRILSDNVEKAPAALIEAAIKNGARDNVTALVFAIDESAGPRSMVIGSTLALAALEQSSFFSGFSSDELLRVQNVANGLELQPGQALYDAGQQVSSFYLVVAGQLSVCRDGQRIALVDPGDPSGELSLTPQATDHQLRAEMPTLLLEFPHAEVKAFMNTDPLLAAKLNAAALGRMSERLRHAVDLLAKHRAAGLIPPFAAS